MSLLNGALFVLELLNYKDVSPTGFKKMNSC